MTEKAELIGDTNFARRSCKGQACPGAAELQDLEWHSIIRPSPSDPPARMNRSLVLKETRAGFAGIFARTLR
jgi:hypothetical protein